MIILNRENIFLSKKKCLFLHFYLFFLEISSIFIILRNSFTEILKKFHKIMFKCKTLCLTTKTNKQTNKNHIFEGIFTQKINLPPYNEK